MAGTVEMRGDFTAWQSVSLRRSSDDWWEVALPMTAGTHQVEIRVDGGVWRPPDSLVAIEGAYGDRVGMFVIE